MDYSYLSPECLGENKIDIPDSNRKAILEMVGNLPGEFYSKERFVMWDFIHKILPETNNRKCRLDGNKDGTKMFIYFID